MTVTRFTLQAMKHTLLATSPGQCPWQLAPQLQWSTQHFAHLHVMATATNMFPAFRLTIGLSGDTFQTGFVDIETG